MGKMTDVLNVHQSLRNEQMIERMERQEALIRRVLAVEAENRQQASHLNELRNTVFELDGVIDKINSMEDKAAAFLYLTAFQSEFAELLSTATRELESFDDKSFVKGVEEKIDGTLAALAGALEDRERATCQAIAERRRQLQETDADLRSAMGSLFAKKSKTFKGSGLGWLGAIYFFMFILGLVWITPPADDNMPAAIMICILFGIAVPIHLHRRKVLTAIDQEISAREHKILRAQEESGRFKELMVDPFCREHPEFNQLMRQFMADLASSAKTTGNSGHDPNH
jgi:hypothetical protein